MRCYRLLLLCLPLFLFTAAAAAEDNDVDSLFCMNGEQGLKRALKKGLDPNMERWGEPPLAHCLWENNDWAVPLLLAAGASVHIEENPGGSLLHRAAPWANATTLAQLIKAGTPVSLENNAGQTALFIAAEKNPHVDALRILLDSGADLHKKDVDGVTPLLLAASNKNPAVFAFLLEKGGDLSTVTRQGKNILFFAAGNTALVEKLLADGITPFTVQALPSKDKEIDERTALDRAAGLGNWDAVRLLAKAKDTATRIPASFQYKDPQAKKRLLELLQLGADPNAVDLEGAWQIEEEDEEDEDAASERDGLYYAAPLMRVASFGQDAELVRILFDAGANIEDRDEAGQTPLFYACSNPDSRMLQAFLQAGAYPAAQDDEGERPLDCVVRSLLFMDKLPESSVREKVEMLLAGGADINAQDNAGRSVLFKLVPRSYYSSRQASKEFIQFLFGCGANVHQADNNQVPPIFWVACYADAATVDVFLEAGADVTARDAEGQDIFFWAASNRSAAGRVLAKLLAAEFFPDGADRFGRTPVMYLGAYSQDTSALPILMQVGASMEATDNAGMTPLMWAYGNRFSKEMISSFLAHAKYVSQRDKAGRTVLHHAVGGQSDLELINVLIKRIEALPSDLSDVRMPDWGVEARDKKGRTPLMYAAIGSRSQVAEVLLKKGAAVNAVDAQGWTALHHWASGGASSFVLNVLFDHGADSQAVTSANETALHVLGRFIEQPPTITMPSFSARGRKPPANKYVPYKHLNVVVDKLLEKGTPVDVKDSNGRTALMHFAANDFSESAVKLLLQAGASVHTVDKNGMTPLLYAASNKNANDALTAILVAGANPLATDNNGNSALHHAVMSLRLEGKLEVLLGTGVPVNAKNKQGKTAHDL
ncbi:hypothetical protein AAG570_014006, partial [Ranatra chinensis]